MTGVSAMEREKLVDMAKAAMKMAYAPYSEFFVGAALLTAEGKVYTGCNIENSTYTPTNCAERTAFFKAVSEGERNFEKIAIVGGPRGEIKGFAAPCGVCRQVMEEFCDSSSFEIILYDGKEIKSFTLGELLPVSFGADDLHK